MTHDITFSMGHDLLTFVSAAVIAVMALFMLGVRVPHAPQWKAYRRMRIMLAVAYMLLAVSGFVTSIMQLEEGSQAWLSAVTLVVASLQALMFTATTVTFVSPLSINLRWFLPQIVGILAGGAAVIGTLACIPHSFPWLSGRLRQPTPCSSRSTGVTSAAASPVRGTPRSTLRR